MDPTEYHQVAKKSPSQETLPIRLTPEIEIGGEKFVVFAGPCRVESESQLSACAEVVIGNGAQVLRAGAYKPCTSPHSNWGMEEEGLGILKSVSKEFKIPTITEAMDLEQLKLVEHYTDILQVGARNSQNYSFLNALGQLELPVMLKRGPWMNLRETLCAAEWVYADIPEKNKTGNKNLFLCERGSVHYNDHMRWTLDLAMVPSVKQHSFLPMIVDISHGTGSKGNTEFYTELAKAAVAIGADGLMVEVHPDPSKSQSDSDQTLGFSEFEKMMTSIKPIIEAVGKKL